ncbi:MAG: carboxypeptidase-like regulatory domain-containing protein, partial [bacterium]
MTGETRPDGTFELAPLATGYYRVRALMPDYRTADLPRVRVREGAWTKLDIALERAGPAGLEMLSEAKRERRQVATQALRREELQRVPGTFGDPVKALQSLPGVGTPNQFLGLLIVQGGGPQDNRLYLDHTPMDYPYHFLGLVSVLHPDFVRGMDLASAGFGPSEGRVTGSVLSIESRPPRHDRFGGSADINPILPNLLLEGPIGRTSWLVAGRRSYLDLITRSQDIPVNVAFWDYQARGDIPVGKVEGEALAYGADDRMSVSGTFRNSTQPIRFSLHNRFDTQGAGASWRAGGSRVRVTASHTRTTQGYDYGGALSLTAEADRTGGR